MIPAARERLAGQRARLNHWRVRVQQPAPVRRLQRRLLGTALDAAERAVLAQVVRSVEADGSIPDRQWPVGLRDLTDALHEEFFEADVRAAIRRLAAQGLLLHTGDEVSLTSAGITSLGRRRRWRLRPRRTPAWVFDRADARTRARQALHTARAELEAVRELGPPARSDAALRSAIRTIDRIADSLN